MNFEHVVSTWKAAYRFHQCSNAAYAYVSVDVCVCVCLCVWNPVAKGYTIKSKGLRARHWHLSQRRLQVTGGLKTYPRIKGEGAHGSSRQLVALISLSWQLE